MKLTTTVGHLTLEQPIMNAAGPLCKTVEEVRKLALSTASAVMVGSITWEERLGNGGNTYYSRRGQFSVNSLGLPNGGRAYYQKHLREMARICHEARKTFWVSVAGFTPEDYVRLVALAIEGGADVVEINLGCPNVWDGGKQKSIASFDTVLTKQILAGIERLVSADSSVSFAAKLSPYLNSLLPLQEGLQVSPYSHDPLILEKMAKVIVESGIVRIVTSANTVPNAFAVREDGTPAIQSPDVKDGVGGLAGPIVIAMGIAQVRRLRGLLPFQIDIIGVGGIRTGEDVLSYLNAGADAVQIATTHADEGARVFDRILMEYVALIEVETPIAP